MKYVRVKNEHADGAKDLVVLTLMRFGISRANFNWDVAYKVLLETPQKDILCKSFIRNQKYVYNSLADI